MLHDVLHDEVEDLDRQFRALSRPLHGPTQLGPLVPMTQRYLAALGMARNALEAMVDECGPVGSHLDALRLRDVDVSVMAGARSSDGALIPDAFSFWRVRKARPIDLRGFKAHPLAMAHHCVVQLPGERTRVSPRRFFVPLANGGIRLLSTERPWTTADISKHADTAFRLTLGLRYDWSVVLQEADWPVSVRFTTTPEGARAVFRLRDVPPGAARRKALLHWVTGHWRRSGPTFDARTFVRPHMRGTTTFDWNGLRATIQPSAYDAERAAS